MAVLAEKESEQNTVSIKKRSNLPKMEAIKSER